MIYRNKPNKIQVYQIGNDVVPNWLYSLNVQGIAQFIQEPRKIGFCREEPKMSAIVQTTTGRVEANEGDYICYEEGYLFVYPKEYFEKRYHFLELEEDEKEETNINVEKGVEDMEGYTWQYSQDYLEEDEYEEEYEEEEDDE